MEQQQQQQQMNSGLTRYRSAPSSYFAELTSGNFYGGGGEVADQYININPRASSPDSDRFFSRFVSSCGGEGTSLQNTCDMRPESSFVNEQVQGQYMAKHEPDVSNLQQHQQIVYNQSQSHQLDHKKPVGLVQSVVNNSIFNNVGSSMGMDNLGQMKMAGGSNSNLIRQSSSPAGLFAQVNIDNECLAAGYALMRGMGKSDAASNIPAKALASSGTRLNNQIEFPPDTPSLSGRRPPHAFKAEAKSYGGGGAAASPESGSYGESAGVYLGGDFGHTSWNDSPLLSDNFLAGIAENDRTNYSAVNSSSNQISEGRSRPSTILAHHLSLPTSSAELSAVEKLWQHSDSVPMKTRAKRGYATHPRSIAERVRRTKISERMRKLQDLVPNMDKQTNTADMLDLSVEYIKDLQKQVKTLSDLRAKCTCSNKQKT